MESSTYLFGRRFKNRLFVGGLPLNITAQELASFFSYFGQVVEAKVIYDEHQVPKGYGFVTFTSEAEVRNVTEMGTLFLGNKKLNLGPAVKKQVPQPVENPELVVVASNHMKGDFYYPVPYATQTPQFPYYQHQMPTFQSQFNPDNSMPPVQYSCIQGPPYVIPYGEQIPMSPALMCQMPPINNANVPSKRRPRMQPRAPRFRRSRHREN